MLGLSKIDVDFYKLNCSTSPVASVANYIFKLMPHCRL